MVFRAHYIPYILILGLFISLVGNTTTYWHDMLSLKPTDLTNLPSRNVSTKPQPIPVSTKMKTQVLGSITKKKTTPTPTPQATPIGSTAEEKKVEAVTPSQTSVEHTDSPNQSEPTPQPTQELAPDTIAGSQRALILPAITARLTVEIPGILHL